MTARTGRDPASGTASCPANSASRLRARRRAGDAGAEGSARSCPRRRSATTELAGEADHGRARQGARRRRPVGGIKVVTRSGWFAARPSGTEDIYKIYAESFRGREHLRRILSEAQIIVDAAIAGA